MMRSGQIKARDLVLIIALVFVGFAISYLNLVGVVPRAFVVPSYAALVLVIGYLGIRVVSSAFVAVASPRMGATRTLGVKNLFQVASAAGLLVVAVAILRVNITGVLVGAGFLGIVLGLAAQQVLGNLFAGLSMLVYRPFDLGDRVTLATNAYGLTGSSYSHESQAAGFEGVVIDIGIFYTRLRLDDGTPALFPNSAVIASMVIQHSRVNPQLIQSRIDLDKAVPFDEFKTRMQEVLQKLEGVDVRESRVEMENIGDDTYQVMLMVWTRSSDVPSVKTTVLQEALRIQKELQPPPPTTPEAAKP